MLDSLQLQLCDIQGRLFELSGERGFESTWFIRAFMMSETAAHFDLPYDRTQWMGEEYLLEEILDGAGVPKKSHIYSQDELYWIGYIYRYWHFLTGETSREIYGRADAKLMCSIYPGFHTLGCEQAIERIRESIEL